MTYPPTRGDADRESAPPLRVHAGGPAAAIAAVASLALVGAALLGFGTTGLRAGQTRSELSLPAPVRALAGPTSRPSDSPSSAKSPTGTASSGTEGPNATADTTRNPGARPADLPTEGSGRLLSPATTATATPDRPPLSTGWPSPSKQPPNSPQSPTFDSPFTELDIVQAQRTVTQQVRAALRRVPPQAQPASSGLLSFQGRNSMAMLTRQTKAETEQADAAVLALRGRLHAPVEAAMVSAASSSFDVAVSAKKTGVSDQRLRAAVRRSFNDGLPQAFDQKVLPVVQSAVTEIIPQLSQSPAMAFAVQSATTEVVQSTSQDVVLDVVGQVSEIDPTAAPLTPTDTTSPTAPEPTTGSTDPVTTAPGTTPAPVQPTGTPSVADSSSSSRTENPGGVTVTIPADVDSQATTQPEPTTTTSTETQTPPPSPTESTEPTPTDPVVDPALPASTDPAVVSPY
jgi:hypothetical protein